MPDEPHQDVGRPTPLPPPQLIPAPLPRPTLRWIKSFPAMRRIYQTEERYTILKTSSLPSLRELYQRHEEEIRRLASLECLATECCQGSPISDLDLDDAECFLINIICATPPETPMDHNALDLRYIDNALLAPPTRSPSFAQQQTSELEQFELEDEDPSIYDSPEEDDDLFSTPETDAQAGFCYPSLSLRETVESVENLTRSGDEEEVTVFSVKHQEPMSEGSIFGDEAEVTTLTLPP
ncbi:hypothetical protein P7C73_g3553, partial [Tremellales sp. Uapishka_1]